MVLGQDEATDIKTDGIGATRAKVSPMAWPDTDTARVSGHAMGLILAFLRAQVRSRCSRSCIFPKK